jgi:hypothetical protein
LFDPPPPSPSPETPEPSQESRPVPKDGYRRKPLPAKDEGAIVFNFTPVKICSIKGCYQPIPQEYERKTCLDCQERCKEYSIRKRARIRANRVEKGLQLRPLRNPIVAAMVAEQSGAAANGDNMDDIPIDPDLALQSMVTDMDADEDMVGSLSPQVGYLLSPKE